MRAPAPLRAMHRTGWDTSFRKPIHVRDCHALSCFHPRCTATRSPAFQAC